MNCIIRHQPLGTRIVSHHNTSISRHDVMVPAHKKLLMSLKTVDAMLPDLLHDGRLHHYERHGPVKRRSSSSYCLNYLTQEANTLTKNPLASLSMSKLGSNIPAANPLLHNAVFHSQSKPVTLALHRRRRPLALKLHNHTIDENPRKTEVLLDNTGSLSRKMEEYRENKRMGRYIHILDNDDSDEEDLEWTKLVTYDNFGNIDWNESIKEKAKPPRQKKITID